MRAVTNTPRNRNQTRKNHLFAVRFVPGTRSYLFDFGHPRIVLFDFGYLGLLDVGSEGEEPRDQKFADLIR